jgi:hypothetical protein
MGPRLRGDDTVETSGNLSPQLPQHRIQLIQIPILDMQRAAFAARIDRDFET